MVALILNRPEYANDIAEEIRLFLGFTDIRLEKSSDAELTMELRLDEERGDCRVSGHAGDFDCVLSFTISDGSALMRKKLEKRHLKLAAYALMRRLYPSVRLPWGSLTGIRPTKLFRELAAGEGTAAAEKRFLNTFDVSPEKTALARAITDLQRPSIESARPDDIDIYLGIPYCRTRCLYCSFGSAVPKRAEEIDGYLHTLYEDITLGARLVKEGGLHVRTAYFGGGTPTILSAAQLDALMMHWRRAYGTLGTELTVEAGRPDTIDREKLEVLLAHGVDRISINPQTMNESTLRRVGRTHTAADIIACFELARSLGFHWINMDLIAGLPGETPEDMAHSCAEIIRLQPDNLTVHALAVKRSSRLKATMEDYALPSAEDAETMTAIGADAAKTLGMQPYYMYRQKYMRGNLENVGYARPDCICHYNIDMMEESVSILAHGAGTMSKRVFGSENRIERIPAPKDVLTYCDKLTLLDARKRSLFLD